MKRMLGKIIFFFLAVVSLPSVVFAAPKAVVEEKPAPEVEAVPSVQPTAEKQEEETFRLYRTETGEILTLAASDYIKGVVAAEIPMSYEPEAIKAQAVAAYTYALRLRDSGKPSEELKGADFSDDPSVYQAYLSREEFDAFYGEDAAALWEKCSSAVDAVRGETILYEDEPIAAAFHSTSSGRTESAETVWGSPLAYLVAVDSPGDRSAPAYQAVETRPFAEVEAALKKADPSIVPGDDKAAFLAVRSVSDSGSVTGITVGNRTMTGTEFRAALGLPSANFTVTYLPEEDSYRFVTNGLGHGVGMSQYGANEMAKAGKTYREILSHYYTGVEISAK